MSGSQHPLFTTPQVMPSGQMVGSGQTPGSQLAAALMRRGGGSPNMPPPNFSPPPGAMQAFQQMMKPPTAEGYVQQNMPGQTVDPQTGMGSMPLGHDPYAAMTPQQMAGQVSSVQPIGQAATPSAAYNPVQPTASPDFLQRLLGGGSGSGGSSLPPVTSTSPDMWSQVGSWLSGLKGMGGGQS